MSRRRHLAAWAVVLVALAAIVVPSLVSPTRHVHRYRVPSASMEPTFHVGAHIRVDTDAYRNRAPRIGEIIVFRPPAGAVDDECGVAGQGPGPDTTEQNPHRVPCSRPTPGISRQRYVKRVVALPGDHLAVVGGRPVRNGVVERGPGRPCTNAPGCDLGAITIPPDTYFVMGDNTPESDDSRYWGPVRRPDIEGPVVP